MSMTYEFFVHSTELEFTRNPDGTHHVRVVQAGADPMEFICDLEPFLVARVEITENSEMVRKWDLSEYAVGKVMELDLRINARIRPGSNDKQWTVMVLDRDDCGNPRRGGQG